MRSTLLLFLFISCAAISIAQTPVNSGSQEISEKEGVPVLIKHLPDWEQKQKTAVFVTSKEDLQYYLNDRAVIDRIDFIPGTEAVLASYPAGKLVIVEFATPQASSDADRRVTAFIEESGGSFVYRRIGNYNGFVFDGNDEAAAAALLDQIKYEKVVQWLGAEPSFFPPGESEQQFIRRASSLFIGTVIVIVTGLGSSAIIGVIVGLLYFFVREHRRAALGAFSDAGGMTRLNLDGLSAEPDPARLLKD